MRIGIPGEVKDHEYRVAITPAGVHELTGRGHEVYVQSGAGAGSSLADAHYAAAGAKVLAHAEEVWGVAPAAGVNVVGGSVVSTPLAEAHGLATAELSWVLS